MRKGHVHGQRTDRRQSSTKRRDKNSTSVLDCNLLLLVYDLPIQGPPDPLESVTGTGHSQKKDESMARTSSDSGSDGDAEGYWMRIPPNGGKLFMKTDLSHTKQIYCTV